MKIVGFHIKNFKTILDLKVEGLSDVNVFFGQNNVGKSNVFQALRAGLGFKHSFSFETEKLLDEYKQALAAEFGNIKPFGKNEPFSVSIDFEITIEEKSHFSLEDFQNRINFQFDFTNGAVCSVQSVKTEMIYKLFNANRFESPVNNEIPIVGLEQIVPTFRMIDANRRLASEIWQPANGFQLKGIDDSNLKRMMFYTYLSRDFEQKQKFESIKRVLNSAPYGFGELDVALDPESNEIDIGFVKDDHRVGVENMGSGTQQILLLLGQIFFNNDQSIAVEEPEMNMSPQYQAGLLKILRMLMEDERTQTNQLFISTHSSHLEFSENHYLVTYDGEKGTQVHAASSEAHQRHFAIMSEGGDTGSRLNSTQQVRLYDEVVEDLGLQRGDFVYFLPNKNGRWEVRVSSDVLEEVNNAIDEAE